MSPDARAARQAALLRAAVRHAYERVPFYRRLWDEGGFDPDRVRGPEDLERMPVLPARLARAGIRRGELLARDADAGRMPSFPTSGSGGQRLQVPRGAAEQRLWRAGGLRIWLEHGYRPWHATVQLDPHPKPPHPLQRLGLARTEWISTELPVEQQVAQLARARAGVVAGTPTALRRVARAIDESGDEVTRPRIVFCQGEVLDPWTSALIRRVLGTAPVGVYGLTELGYVAWQCERRDGYHVNADTCVVEVVRDGRPAGAGEVGTVLVTDLRGRTAPLLRYETGDLAVAARAPCPCGRTLPLLRSVEGRARDAVALRDGRLVTTRGLLDHMDVALAPDRYALVRHGGGLRLHLEAPAEAGAVERLRGLLGKVELDVVAGVPRAASRDKSQPLRAAVTAAPPGAP
ncbi:MAG: hypothetical protein QOD53_590 [Thermoleophilaceae bacterium]|nr:hypothetical protein [Thermoleophilaceae bacterium]